jgi:hypothetical protein
VGSSLQRVLVPVKHGFTADKRREASSLVRVMKRVLALPHG